MGEVHKPVTKSQTRAVQWGVTRGRKNVPARRDLPKPPSDTFHIAIRSREILGKLAVLGRDALARRWMRSVRRRIGSKRDPMTVLRAIHGAYMAFGIKFHAPYRLIGNASWAYNIRSPSRVLRERRARCASSSLLMGATLRRLGIPFLYASTPGHAVSVMVVEVTPGMKPIPHAIKTRIRRPGSLRHKEVVVIGMDLNYANPSRPDSFQRAVKRGTEFVRNALLNESVVLGDEEGRKWIGAPTGKQQSDYMRKILSR